MSRSRLRSLSPRTTVPLQQTSARNRSNDYSFEFRRAATVRDGLCGGTWLQSRGGATPMQAGVDRGTRRFQPDDGGNRLLPRIHRRAKQHRSPPQSVLAKRLNLCSSRMRSSVIRVPPTRMAPSSSILSGTGSAWIAIDMFDELAETIGNFPLLYVRTVTTLAEEGPIPAQTEARGDMPLCMLTFPRQHVKILAFPASPSSQLPPRHETPQFSEIGRHRRRQHLTSFPATSSAAMETSRPASD